MKTLKPRRQWRNYSKDDFRIEPYCKGECPACRVCKSGQAFCYGKFEKGGKNYRGDGAECTKVVNFCFADDVKLLNGQKKQLGRQACKKEKSGKFATKLYN